LADLRAGMVSSFKDLEKHATCKDDVRRVASTLKSRQEPIKKLRQSVEKAVKDLLTSLGTNKRMNKQAEDKEHQKKKAKVSTLPIFDGAPTASHQVPSLSDPNAKADFNAPFVQSCPTALATLREDGAIAAASQAFEALWQTTPLRHSPGRAAQATTLEVHEKIHTAILSAVSAENAAIPLDQGNEAHKRMLAACNARLCAAAPGKSVGFIGTNGGFPTLRWIWHGTSTVVMIPMQAVMEFLRERVGPDLSKVKNLLNMCCSCLLNATAAEVAKVLPEAYTATVGPGDVLYSPAGWVILEQGPGDAGLLWFRTGILPADATDADTNLKLILHMCQQDGRADAKAAEDAVNLYASRKPPAAVGSIPDEAATRGPADAAKSEKPDKPTGSVEATNSEEPAPEQ
jgi:hypothetical protein